jgi:D-beta-D-heptose 7-phosphate kinase/D-beta-D-heptose 1-phosphate adenosyltransferase
VRNQSRLRQLLESFSGKNILIVGDIMVDQFIWGKVQKISPEAPVPVVEVMDETFRLGGSGNVAANIKAMGGVPIPIAVQGQDVTASRLTELLKQRQIDTSCLVSTDRPTTLKTRIIAHNQQVVRTDRESRKPLPSSVNADLEAAFLRSLPHASAIIVSDYDKGVVNRELLVSIIPKARRAGIPVFLDPKVHHADYYRAITVITPNKREAELLTGLSIQDDESLEQAGRNLCEKFECEYALITRGEEGMSLFNDTSSHHLPTFAREVFDVTGAGDTVIATLAMARASGATMEEAAFLSNHAAGIVVGKIGTATVDRSELLSHLESDQSSRTQHGSGSTSPLIHLP